MVYLDNAATTWPKPETVYQAVVECIKDKGANPGRGSHQMAMEAGRVIYETRELLAKLFNVRDPARIVLTCNATEALNLGIIGLLGPGDHVITTSMEHNAVSRPLKALEENGGAEVTFLPCTPEGLLDPRQVEEAMQENTKLVVVNHASNVNGTIQPIEEIGRITKARQVIFMVDAAQTAGVFPLDVEKLNIDLLAFPGHKSLLGPQGTGGLYIREGVELTPARYGGTGGNSESPYLPEVLPDRYESGTPNTPGIAGLGAGVKFILEKGIHEIRRHEQELTKQLLAGLQSIDQVKIYGLHDPLKQAPVVSINIGEEGSAEVGFILDRAFQIAVRAGLHCAPLAHQTMGTITQGTIRFSLGYFNTAEEIEYTLECIKKIAAEV